MADVVDETPIWRRAVQFLGLRRSMVGMLTMIILVSMGERMGERFLPIYLLALGGGPIAVGVLSALKNLLGALYSLPGGLLAERIGIKRSLIVFNLMSISGYLLVILVPTWWIVLPASALFLVWSMLSQPATMGLVAHVLPPQKRTMGVSMHSLIRRIPMALGPLLGGYMISVHGSVLGMRLAFGAAIIMAVVALFAQQRLIADDHPGQIRTLRSVMLHPIRMLKELRPGLSNLLVSDILIRFCEQIPDAFVVIWAVKTIAHPVSEFEFGVLTAIEMTTAVLCYIPVAYLADRGGKKPFVLMTFVFFTAFPLVLWFSESFWALVFAFVIRGLKEFGEPARKSLILDLAPADRRPSTYGVYYMTRDVIVSLAALGGAFLWKISPETNLLFAFFFGVLGTAWFALRGRDLPGTGRAQDNA